MCYQALISAFVAACQAILSDNLTGIYLHGSMAMGCFHPKKSDIDLLVIVVSGIPDAQKLLLMNQIAALNSHAPAKGLEISFVRKAVCKPFVYPTPFELHFSPIHLPWFFRDPADYVKNMNGEDRDLAAHFTILNKYGVKLCGEEISDVFAPVPRADYIDSIWRDVQDAQSAVLTDPTYTVLNLCRVLAYVKDGEILSKEAGGTWGLRHTPQPYRPLVLQALQCYRCISPAPSDERMAVQFAADMLRAIQNELSSK